MKVKHDTENDLVLILNYKSPYEPGPKIKEPSEIKNKQLISLFGENIILIEPVNDEFLIKYIGSKAFKETFGDEKYIGRYYGDIFPKFKDFMYYYFNKVMETQEAQEVSVKVLKSGIESINTLTFIYEEGQIIINHNENNVYKDEHMESSKKIAIVRGNRIIRYNSAFLEFLNEKNIDPDGLLVDYFENVAELKDNSTHLDLTMQEMVDRTVDVSKDNIIDFHIINKLNNEEHYGISRRIIYNDEPAVEISFVSGLNIFNNQNMLLNFDEIEASKESQSQTFSLVYNAKENSFRWSRELYFYLGLTPLSDTLFHIKDIILDEDLHILDEAHNRLSIDNPTVECKFRIVKTDRIRYVNTYLSAIYDEDDELESITYLCTDNTVDYILNKNLQQLQESINIMQDVTKSALYYKTYSNKYQWTPQIFKILEYDDINEIPENYIDSFDLLVDCLVDESKEELLNHINSLSPENPKNKVEVKLITNKGNTKYLDVHNKMVYDDFEDKISFISSCSEITRFKYAEKDNLKLVTAFNNISKHFKSGVFYKNSHSRFIFSEYFEDVVGLSTENWFEKDRYKFIEYIVNKDEYLELYSKFFETKEIDEVDFEIDYLQDGDENQRKYIRYYLKRSGDDISGYVEDISNTKLYENHLKKINEEKSILIKEVHHRVKNNLQIMSSLLNLEMRFHEGDLDGIVDSTKKRISSMALIHELAYGSSDLETVNIKEYLETFDSNIFSGYFNKNIKFVNYSDDIFLSLKTLTPLILILTELTFNSIKYAFEFDNDKENIIEKSVIKDGDKCILEYKDNGFGFPEGFNFKDSKGLGWKIITSLISQIDGELIQVDSDHGVHFKIMIPINEPKVIK